VTVTTVSTGWRKQQSTSYNQEDPVVLSISVHGILVADTFGVSSSEVTPEPSRDESGAWDSLAHLRNVTAVEEEYEIQFSMKAVEEIKTVKQLEAALQELEAL